MFPLGNRKPALNSTSTFCALRKIRGAHATMAESRLWKLTRDPNYGNPNFPINGTRLVEPTAKPLSGINLNISQLADFTFLRLNLSCLSPSKLQDERGAPSIEAATKSIE